MPIEAKPDFGALRALDHKPRLFPLPHSQPECWGALIEILPLGKRPDGKVGETNHTHFSPFFTQIEWIVAVNSGALWRNSPSKIKAISMENGINGEQWNLPAYLPEHGPTLGVMALRQVLGEVAHMREP